MVRTDAKPAGPTGRYAAVITFPTGGDWRLTFESTDLIMEGSATLTVTPAVPVTPAAAAESAPAVDPLAIGLVAISLLTLLTVIVVALRRRPGRREKSAVASG